MPWTIDGVDAGTVVSESREHTALTLTFEVTGSTYRDVHLPLRETAEKYDRIPDSDGGYRAIDRASQDGIYRLAAPAERVPPRAAEFDAVVASFSARPLEQSEDAYRVTETFVPRYDHGPNYGSGYGETYGSDSTADESRATDEWAFGFYSAQIATKRVRYDPEDSVDSAAGTVTLELVLDASQTQVLEESASRLDAVSVREVPDGANIYEDHSTGAFNTVRVTTPDGTQPIEDGNWIVADWREEWLADGAYRVELTLGKPTRGYSGGYGYAYGD